MRYIKVLLLVLLIFFSLVFFFQNQTALSTAMTLKLNLFAIFLIRGKVKRISLFHVRNCQRQKRAHAHKKRAGLFFNKSGVEASENYSALFTMKKTSLLART